MTLDDEMLKTFGLIAILVLLGFFAAELGVVMLLKWLF